MTNELTINGTTYEFNFGMGFIRQIDPKHTQKANGVTQNIASNELDLDVASNLITEAQYSELQTIFS